MAYTVNSYDICVPGFERLRLNSEFMFTATVYKGVSAQDIEDDFNHQMQNQAQPDGFDYDACRSAISAFISDEIKGRTGQLFGDIEAPEDDQEGCNLYVYMTGPGYADEDEE